MGWYLRLVVKFAAKVRPVGTAALVAHTLAAKAKDVLVTGDFRAV